MISRVKIALMGSKPREATAMEKCLRTCEAGYVRAVCNAIMARSFLTHCVGVLSCLTQHEAGRSVLPK